MWFSDSSILCKVLHSAPAPPPQSQVPPSPIAPSQRVTMLQLRPGEGSSKTIEVDAFYSPHVQQQPQVCYPTSPVTLQVLHTNFDDALTGWH